MTGSKPPATRLMRPSHHTRSLPAVVPQLVTGNAATSSTNAKISAFSFLSMARPPLSSKNNQCDRCCARQDGDEDGPRHGDAQDRPFLAFYTGDARAQHDIGGSDRIAIGAAGRLRGDDCLFGHRVQLSHTALHATKKHVRG